MAGNEDYSMSYSRIIRRRNLLIAILMIAMGPPLGAKTQGTMSGDLLRSIRTAPAGHSPSWGMQKPLTNPPG